MSDRTVPLDVDLIIKKLNHQTETGDQLCIIIGDTGSGKSTFLNWIEGKLLKAMKHGLGRLILDSIDNSIQIGHSSISQTEKASFYLDKQTNTSYVDCPGFEDTRGPEFDIANTICLERLFNNSTNIKVILLISWNHLIDSRKVSLIRTFDAISKKFKNLNDLFQSFGIVISASNNAVQVQDVRVELQKFYKEQSSQRNLQTDDPLLEKFYDFLVYRCPIELFFEPTELGVYKRETNLVQKMLDNLKFSPSLHINLILSLVAQAKLNQFFGKCETFIQDKLEAVIRNLKLEVEKQMDFQIQIPWLFIILNIIDQVASTLQELQNCQKQNFLVNFKQLLDLVGLNFDIESWIDSIIFCKQLVGNENKNLVSSINYSHYLRNCQDLINQSLDLQIQSLEGFFDLISQDLQKKLFEIQEQYFTEMLYQQILNVIHNIADDQKLAQLAKTLNKISEINEIVQRYATFIKFNSLLPLQKRKYQLNIILFQLSKFSNRIQNHLQLLKEKLHKDQIEQLNNLCEQAKKENDEQRLLHHQLMLNHENQTRAYELKLEEIKKENELIKKANQLQKLKHQPVKIEINQQVMLIKKNQKLNLSEIKGDIEKQTLQISIQQYLSGFYFLIFSSQAIEIDTHLYFRGFVCFIAPIIQFTDKADLSLQGIDGESSQYKCEFSNNGSANHGSPGGPGLPGGFFFMRANQYHGIENLQINVNGGNGGRGGDGSSGRDNSQWHFFIPSDSDGQDGGDGGQGGKGGLKGKVEIYQQDQMAAYKVQITQSDGIKGSDGYGGCGGDAYYKLGIFQSGCNGNKGINGGNKIQNNNVSYFSKSATEEFGIQHLSSLYQNYIQQTFTGTDYICFFQS